MFLSLPFAVNGERQRASQHEAARDYRLDDFDSNLTGISRMQGEVRAFDNGVSLRSRERDARGIGVQLNPAAAPWNEPEIEGFYQARTYPTWGAHSDRRFKNEIWGGSFQSKAGNSLRLHAEYAVSRKGHPALQRADEDLTGPAYLLDAQYSATLAFLAGEPVIWQVDLNRKQAGHAFWSPPTGAAVAGTRIDQASSRLDWADLSAGLQYQHATKLPRPESAVGGHRTNELALNVACAVDLPPPLVGLQPLLGEDFTISMTRERGTSLTPTTGDQHRSGSVSI